MAGRERLAQRAGHVFEVELLCHLSEDAVVSLGIRLACRDISLRFEAQAQLCILLIAYTHIHVLHQWSHHALRLLRSPQFFAEVEVDAHRHPLPHSSLASQFDKQCRLVADGGSDTAPVEPVSPLHDGIEVEVIGFGFGYCAMSPVVYHL